MSQPGYDTIGYSKKVHDIFIEYIQKVDMTSECLFRENSNGVRKEKVQQMAVR